MNVTGIVMSVDRKFAVVMLPQGEFRRIAVRGRQWAVGEEIKVPTRTRAAIWRTWPALPAAGIAGVLAIVVPSLAGVQAAAVVSVDINPSVNLEVGASGRILAAKGLDRDGVKLLHQTPVVGLPAQGAVASLVRQAGVDGYLNAANTVLLGGLFESSQPKWFEAADKAVGAALRADHQRAVVVTVTGVSTQPRQSFDRPQLSVGRYLLWQDASSQKHWSLPQVRSMPVGRLVKETANSSTAPSKHAQEHASHPASAPKAITIHIPPSVGGGPSPKKSAAPPTSRPTTGLVPPSHPASGHTHSRSGHTHSRSGAPPGHGGGERRENHGANKSRDSHGVGPPLSSVGIHVSGIVGNANRSPQHGSGDRQDSHGSSKRTPRLRKGHGSDTQGKSRKHESHDRRHGHKHFLLQVPSWLHRP